MGHRLDIASGKNEFNRRLGNFRVQIKLDDEGERVATITASILAAPSLSEHLRSSGIPSTVDFSTPTPDALRLAVSTLRAAQSAGLTLPTDLSVQSAPGDFARLGFDYSDGAGPASRCALDFRREAAH